MGLLLVAGPFGSALDRLSYDFAYLLRLPVKQTDVVLVLMDDESHARLGQEVGKVWDRSLHVRLMRTLHEQGAKTVVFDIKFYETNGLVDTELAGAFGRHTAGGRTQVVVGAEFFSDKTDYGRIQGLQGVVEPIASSCSLGAMELPKDADSAIRRHPTDYQSQSLAWQAAVLLDHPPTDSTKTRWINYYGSGRQIPRVSYYKVLEPQALSGNYFSNKVVFVGKAVRLGRAGPMEDDFHNTPSTRWFGTTSTGVEIHATVFLNLIRQDWLTRLPWATELAVVFLFGVAATFGLTSLRPRIGIVMGLVLLVGLPLVFICQTWLTLVWFCWAPISFFQVPLLMGLIATGALGGRQTEPFMTEEEPQETVRIPDHVLVHLIGKGGYGEVWLARNALGQYRAIKIVRRDSFSGPDAYKREFKGMTRFEGFSREHEGFVDILHVGKSPNDSYFYYIMEIADDCRLGQQINPDDYTPKTLAKELKTRGRLSVDECVHVGLLLTDALQYLDDQKLVHRDIKPPNIVYVNGRLKLADIGLVAKAGEANSYVGTAGFMPPEGPGTIQADIYSLGKVLYECLTGQDCREFPQLPADLIANGTEPRFGQLNRIVLKACADNPRERYRSARRMHEDLQLLSAKGGKHK